MEIEEVIARAIRETVNPYSSRYISKINAMEGSPEHAAHEVLTALAEAGLVVVPREPTEAMLAEAVPEPTHLYVGRSEVDQQALKNALTIDRLVVRQHWRDMISATTTSPDERA